MKPAYGFERGGGYGEMIPIYIPYEEQDELGSAIVERRESKANKNKPYVDIFALAESFGLKIDYESFAEDDPNKDGFLANGVDSLKIWRNGVKADIIFPDGTIVIDNYLLGRHQESKLRFTVAHEIAHHICNIHGHASNFHAEFDAERDYTPEELKKRFNYKETQANNLAGILLLPSHKLKKVYKQVTGGKLLTMYGDRTIDADTREKITAMAKMMHVSPLTMRIRLERLKLFNRLPIYQYIDSGCFDLDNYCFYIEESDNELPF